MNSRKDGKLLLFQLTIKIENRQIALDLTKTNQILKQAEKIALRDCPCRVTLQNCELPQNTCILLNKRAEDFVKEERAKWITLEQARNIISETHKKGLVHLAMLQSSKTNQFPLEICSCCSCCY